MVTTGAAAVALLLTGSVAFADTAQQTGQGTEGWGRMGERPGMMGQHAPGVFGKVIAVSGTTITVQSVMPMRPNQTGTTGAPAPTTYTVDASNATITKDGSASSIGAVAVGDSVMVDGTVNGTSVTATQIHDGQPPRGGMMGDKRGWGGASTTPGMMRGQNPQGPMAQLAGNGQPVIGGTVSAVSGTTLTITNNNGKSTYSIDASAATVVKAGATSTLAAIQVGDAVLAQGAINGTNVTASSVMDQGQRSAGASGTTAEQGTQDGNATPRMGSMMNFFGGIGGFFKHLFGF